MSVSDCEEGKRLLKAATQAHAGSEAREEFLQHIKLCLVCKAHRSVIPNPSNF
jgi:hypothetical protein